MIEALFNQTNYAATKKVLDAAMLRHEAIAANLANVETPGYKRVDIATSFSSELNQAIAAHEPSRINALRPSLELDSRAVAGTRDGNNISLETELLNLQQNTLTHTVGTQLLSGALLKLRLAITGRSS